MCFLHTWTGLSHTDKALSHNPRLFYPTLATVSRTAALFVTGVAHDGRCKMRDCFLAGKPSAPTTTSRGVERFQTQSSRARMQRCCTPVANVIPSRQFSTPHGSAAAGARQGINRVRCRCDFEKMPRRNAAALYLPARRRAQGAGRSDVTRVRGRSSPGREEIGRPPGDRLTLAVRVNSV